MCMQRCGEPPVGRLITLLLIVLSLIYVSKTTGEVRATNNNSFYTEGELTYKAVNSTTGVPIVQYTREFRFAVDGDKWNATISVARLARAANTNFIVLRDEVTGNGSEVVFLKVPNTNINSNLISQNGSTNNILKNRLPTARIFSGQVPPAEGTDVTPLWLAFASAPYLNTIHNQLLKQMWYVTDDVFQNTPIKGIVLMHKSAPFLVESINFISDGSTVTSKGAPYRFPKPFGTGFLQASFLASEFADVQGLQIPKLFSLEVLVPKSMGTTTNDLVCITSWHGRVTNANYLVGSLDGHPKLAGKAIVKDHRTLTQSNAVIAKSYLITNNWLKTNEARFVAITTPPNLKRDERMRSVRMAFVVCFLGLSIIAFVLLLKSSESNKQNKKNEKANKHQ